MMGRFALMVAAGLAAAAPALAEPPAGDPAAKAKDALSTVNGMTPEQRKAAATAAQAQLPALAGAAADYWSKLSPEQKAAYQQQLKGLLAPPKDK